MPSRLPGRFHRADLGEPVQYACLHPLGPWAELMRRHDLAAAAKLAAVRQRAWALRVELDGLVRIGFGEAADHGLRPGDLVSDDQRRCQALGDRLRAAGAAGAIVPSAALPGTDNLVLFGPRAAAPYLLEPLTAVDVPASICAEGGRPLAGLLERVRFRGAPHAALEAWRAGEEHRFAEPSWSLVPII